MIRSVPTTVMITPQGKVVIVFERSAVQYDLTIDGLVQCLESNADVQSIPHPPVLTKVTQTSLALSWMLVDPPGLTQYVEVQFRRLRAAPDTGTGPPKD